MRIQEIEEKTGITSHNIRYYEKEKLVIPQRNPLNGYREYSEDDVNRLNAIKLLRMMNISVKSIREYFDGETSLEVILNNNAYALVEEENRIRESKLLNQYFLKSGISTEIPVEIINEILKDEKLYIKTLEQIKRQDVWDIRKFVFKQILCIVGWLGISITTIMFVIAMMKNYVGKGMLAIYILLIIFVFVLMGRIIYQNEKSYDDV